MKSKIWILILIISLLMSFNVFSQAAKDRIDKMNPVAKAFDLGEMLNTITLALSGNDVLFDSVAVLGYGTGANDTTKIMLRSAVNCYFDGNLTPIPVTTVAFTATTHDIANTKYGSFKISVASDSTVTITKSASVYDTKAEAIAAVPATPAGGISLGYVVIHANGALFDATTTKLNASTLEVWWYPANGYINDLRKTLKNLTH